MMRASSSPVVRPVAPRDLPHLLELMRALAEFERYADRFAATEADLLERCFGPLRQFDALVAEDPERPGALIGMAVYYFVPYTIDLRPDLVLKELYVDRDGRSKGIGGALMRGLNERAAIAGCGRIRWLVLPDNEPAKRFYRRCGGRHDTDWESWSMPVTRDDVQRRQSS